MQKLQMTISTDRKLSPWRVSTTCWQDLGASLASLGSGTHLIPIFMVTQLDLATLPQQGGGSYVRRSGARRSVIRWTVTEVLVLILKAERFMARGERFLQIRRQTDRYTCLTPRWVNRHDDSCEGE